MQAQKPQLSFLTTALSGARLKTNDALRIDIRWDLSQIIGITGVSGAGKSTLLRRIAGLDDTVASTLHINEQAIKGGQRATNPCVYVGDDTPLFEHLSLRRNLALAEQMSVWNKGQQASSLKALYGFDACPTLSLEDVAELCEIQTLLDSPCSVLSSGESQRAMIARALLSGKPILLLDEALSAMDWALRKRLHWRLKHLSASGSRVIVMISHSFRELAVMSDVLVEIDQGEVSKQVATLKYMQDNEGDTEATFSTLQVKHVSDDTLNNLSVFMLANSQVKIIAKLTKEAGQTTRLLLDANALVLSKQSSLQSSMLNCLCGSITEIKAQDKAIAVHVELEGQKVIAHISQKSASDMQLNKNDEIYVYFKAI